MRKSYMQVTALIVAAGSGKRMGQKVPKQFLLLGNKPILVHTLEVFENSDFVQEVVLVVPKKTQKYCTEKIIKKYNLKKITKIVNGGQRRQDSVYEGLKQVDKNCQILIIHDGVRPFITDKVIVDSLKMIKRHKACIFALPVKETVKSIDNKGLVRKTLKREDLRLVQTPQVFDFSLIRKAYEKAFKDKFYGTDDAILVERLGQRVKVLTGSEYNIKITTLQDLIIAKYIWSNKLTTRGAPEGAS